MGGHDYEIQGGGNKGTTPRGPIPVQDPSLLPLYDEYDSARGERNSLGFWATYSPTSQ